MQIISATKTAKETILNRKRNLFGLGLTSLIAACGGDKTTNAGGGGETEEERIAREAREAEEKAQEARADALPFKALASEDESGFTTTKSGGADSLTVAVEKPASSETVTLTFVDATEGGANANIYKLTANLDQYDLVISAPNIDKNSATDNPEYQKGGIFIYWNVAEVKDETIGETATATSSYLEAKGAIKEDQIGIHAPEFLKIGGTDNKYDMIIRSEYVDVDSSAENAGAIYILWDVVDYSGGIKTIDLGDNDDASNLNATAGSLTIYGLTRADWIGIYAPEFLQIGGVAGDKLDMVIRSHGVDNPDGSSSYQNNEGAIYILWDVEDYYSAGQKKINLGLDASSNADPNYATSGLLTITGDRNKGEIGIYAPDFLQIGGEVDSYDMVIARPDNSGAIYILWDIENYYKDTGGNIANKNINLNTKAGADYGSLGIIGATKSDGIGIHASEFLQLGGADSNYDMVIRSERVDNKGDGLFGSLGNNTNEGAIYVLWDVEDYYQNTAHKTINLGLISDQGYYPTSGLLTIYGAYETAPSDPFESLGSDSNNILYGDDGEGNKILTDIDADGTIDIAFRDKDYTYILFGDKIATTTGTGVDEKVGSKTIDLDKVNVNGFFKYNGTDLTDTSNHTANTTVNKAEATGYRFAGRKADLAKVQEDYDTANSAALSDADTDLGVWDIA